MKVPDAAPLVYTHFTELLLELAVLNSPTQSLAELPAGAVHVAVTLPPALTEVGEANTI